MENILSQHLIKAFKSLYNVDVPVNTFQFQKTRKEFDGDITLIVFPLLRLSKNKPEQTGEDLGNYLKENVEGVDRYNVVKGFLNIGLSQNYWITIFSDIAKTDNYGVLPESGETYMVEYSSPNTNKPLHLGHLRNIFLGYSVSGILKANGHKVVKVQIINDRGIHICKSMLAWKKEGADKTPVSTSMKGDKLVGHYYVEFDKTYKKEITELIEQGHDKKTAEKEAPSLKEAQQMLKRWEAGDEEIVALWKKMNGWVYEGFNVTYKQMGVDFDKLYYESDTYLLGKRVIEEGLKKGVFLKKEDGSVWCDLTDEGLDEKLVLRSDGTAVYMTQDIGTAIERYKDYPDLNGIIYTVGNEQDYHFKVLFLILKKLGYDWADGCFHLSYGMVDLPTGKMKSREGTVVDADDLMVEMVETARRSTEELGKLDGLTDNEKHDIADMIGMGALKYFLLKVDPKKRMMFNPEESIDFQGNTGPFIQYAFARISSILRKADKINVDFTIDKLQSEETELIKLMNDLPEVIEEAGKLYSPALIANYTYDLVKAFNQFYQNHTILNEQDDNIRQMRLALCKVCGEIIERSMNLLGIRVPERM